MDKEPNINKRREISVNELVLDASKVEQKYEKQQEKQLKTSLRKKQIDHIFHGLRSYRP